ncbi:MAG: di-trans,poly-cis-decaprenylcistransferase [Gemmatimonadetes bacterium]|nr:di-trans,poly-cis-decaprenylcistransferase [Gemmatimonadota bacterium]
MTQSAFRPSPPGLHVGIIMDGNGRWAVARGRPRVSGHRAGARSVRRTVEAAPDLGIGTLTLYAFSADNWSRPEREVAALMRLFERHLRREVGELVENGVRLSVVGRRDRLPSRLVRAIEGAEALTAGGRRLLLRVAMDYSSREAILEAAARAARLDEPPTRETFARLLGEATHGGAPAPDLDLVIRTGGEQRLSDFFLWEAAYAELVFTDRMWPDFGSRDLAAAVVEYQRRERRFGAVTGQAAG